MKRAIRILALVAAIGCQVFAENELSATRQIDEKERSAGVHAATEDTAKGAIRYEVVGQPMAIDQEIARRALSEFGIIVEFSGCTGNPRADYAGAYREIVINHLKTKYGFDPVMRIQGDLMKKKAGT